MRAEYREPFGEFSEDIYQRNIRESPSYPYVSRASELMIYAVARHYVYRRFWTVHSAAPSARALPPHFPSACGQELPSSYQLHEDLSGRYPKEKFFVSIGSIFFLGDSIPTIPSHVWVTQKCDTQAQNIIIDVTADNAGFGGVVVNRYAKLLEAGVVYKADRSFNTSDELFGTLEKYEPGVRQRVNYFTAPLHEIDQMALERHRQSSQNLHDLLGDAAGAVWAAVLQDARVADRPSENIE